MVCAQRNLESSWDTLFLKNLDDFLDKEKESGDDKSLFCVRARH